MARASFMVDSAVQSIAYVPMPDMLDTPPTVPAALEVAPIIQGVTLEHFADALNKDSFGSTSYGNIYSWSHHWRFWTCSHDNAVWLSVRHTKSTNLDIGGWSLEHYKQQQQWPTMEAVKDVTNNPPVQVTVQCTFWRELSDAISSIWATLLRDQVIIWPSVTYGLLPSGGHYLFDRDICYDYHKELASARWRRIAWTPRITAMQQHVVSGLRFPVLPAEVHDTWYKANRVLLVDDDEHGGDSDELD